MGNTASSWVVGCGLGLSACGGAPAEPVSVPRPLPSATAEPPRAAPKRELSPQPMKVTLDATPLAYDRVKVERSASSLPSVTAKGQTYALPLRQAALVNLERDVLAKGLLDRGSAELAKLLAEGSVIVPAPSWASKPDVSWRFDKTYAELEQRRIPALVTTDAVLHHQHVFFNEILKAVEVRTLEPMLRSLVAGLYDDLLPQLAGEAPSDSAVNELSLLAVARKTLEPAFEPHALLATRVLSDLKLMQAHVGPAVSAAQSDQRCIDSVGQAGRCAIEDFSQYVVRGHYTVSPVLSRYFLASMWLGRMGRRVKYDSEIQQQVLLIEAVKRARCQLDGVSVPAVQLLARMDQLLELFIGKSDDLTLPEVDRALRAELSPGVEVELTGARLTSLRKALRELRAPRVLSGVITEYGADAATTTRDETQGLRLLGQRFAPDSEVLGRLVREHVGPDPEHARFAEVAQDTLSNRGDYCDHLSPQVRAGIATLQRSNFSIEASRCVCERAIVLWLAAGRPVARESTNGELTQVCRHMPSALDVASVMGSSLADRYLAPSRKYAGYERELAALRQASAEARKRAPENLYEEWLRALAPLLGGVPKTYPTWMTGLPYQKKSLRTYAASWTELRQDTILYVKQSYTGGRTIITSGGTILMEPEAYGMVEARPDLYGEVKTFTNQLRVTLKALDALSPELDRSLAGFTALLDRLIDISTRQLQGKRLEEADQELIKHIGPYLFGVVSQLLAATAPPGPPATDPSQPYLSKESQGVDEALRVPLVADVHTDVHTRRVLEEGTGPLEWLLVVTRTPDGKLSVSVGPVFSYKELVHPLSDRLTNEKWRGPMKAGQDLPAPLWWTSDRPLANGFELPPFTTPPH